jgi:hypothetical protein
VLRPGCGEPGEVVETGSAAAAMSTPRSER